MIYKEDMNIQENDVQLISNLSIPSNVHGYSLGIDYMKQWFLKEFDSKFFKTIYVEGKYIFDDLVNVKKHFIISRDKPMLSITPTINPDYNRDNLDLQLAGRNLLIRRSSYIEYAFLSDIPDNQYLGVQLREMEMNFTFKIRTGTRASQLDLLEFMKLAFRVGSTQGEYLTMDFHVPYEIMISIATSKGFELEKDRNGDRYRIKDIPNFLKYLNSHSQLLFLYKYRAINGNSEFFIKMHNLYTHISNIDSISIDDGEREGVNDNNYHLEMNCILHMPVPHFYYLYNNNSLDRRYKELNNLAGLYSLDIFKVQPPETNSDGWRQYLSTEYMEDDNNFTTIEFKELLENGDLLRVMSYSKKSGISPRVFMDVIIYCGYKPVDIDIDWENFIININKELVDNQLLITIYLDLNYVNDLLEVIDNVYESRIETEKNT